MSTPENKARDAILTFQKFLADKEVLFKFKQHLSRMYGNKAWTRVVINREPFEWLVMISQADIDEPIWSDLPEGHNYWVRIHQGWLDHYELFDALWKEQMNEY